MKVTVQVNLQKLQTMLPTLQARFKKVAGPPLKEAVLDAIAKGISPVKGEGRFVEYSDSYKAAIMGGDSLSIESALLEKYGKGVRPVNLKVTGTMLGSGKTEESATGVRLSFSDALADVHNRQGAGKSKVVRHFMPTVPGENYSKVILDKMLGVVQDLVTEEIRRQNA